MCHSTAYSGHHCGQWKTGNRNGSISRRQASLPGCLLSTACPPGHEGNSPSRCREFSRPTKTLFIPSSRIISLGQGKRKHARARARVSCAPVVGTFNPETKAADKGFLRSEKSWRPGGAESRGIFSIRRQSSRSRARLLPSCFNFA